MDCPNCGHKFDGRKKPQQKAETTKVIDFFVEEARNHELPEPIINMAAARKLVKRVLPQMEMPEIHELIVAYMENGAREHGVHINTCFSTYNINKFRAGGDDF